jgi:hypothetical protein
LTDLEEAVRPQRPPDGRQAERRLLRSRARLLILQGCATYCAYVSTVAGGPAPAGRGVRGKRRKAAACISRVNLASGVCSPEMRKRSLGGKSYPTSVMVSRSKYAWPTSSFAPTGVSNVHARSAAPGGPRPIALKRGRSECLAANPDGRRHEVRRVPHDPYSTLSTP